MLLTILAGACANAVGDGSDAEPAPPARGQAAPAPQGDAPAPDEDPPPAAPDDAPPAPHADDDEVPGDDDGDGVVNVGDAGPPPAEAAETCAEWTDCGPHYDDPNSGFDCVDGACTCDDNGRWAAACADLGGSWSSFECFCFTDTETMMPTAAPETPEQAEDDVVCWWSWRLRSCDPDEWVDTSYYEHWCDAYDCYDEYVEDGYYVDGQCYGRWIKRCTDGNEYWY